MLFQTMRFLSVLLPTCLFALSNTPLMLQTKNSPLCINYSTNHLGGEGFQNVAPTHPTQLSNHSTFKEYFIMLVP